jgi:hypothetical protein
MKKIWHPYWKWEEWQNGMWRKVSKDEERRMLPLAVSFTGDHELYGQYMKRVTQEWTISCEHNLTDSSLNRLAWVGHAAVCFWNGTPEYITRLAWGKLTDLQRQLADEAAELAVISWIKKRNGGDYGAQENFCF